jgi:hypothetical protein
MIPSTCRCPSRTSLTPCLICAQKYPLLPLIGLKFVVIISISPLCGFRTIAFDCALGICSVNTNSPQYSQLQAHLERKPTEKEKRFHHIDPDVMYYTLSFHILE